MINMQKLYVENCDGETYIPAEETCHYVYAHGILERKSKYDIVCYPEGETFDFRNDRIEDVIAVLYNGEEHNAKLFFWHSKPHDERSKMYMAKNPVYLCHGLLVAIDDTEALKDAEKKYNERRNFI